MKESASLALGKNSTALSNSAHRFTPVHSRTHPHIAVHAGTRQCTHRYTPLHTSVNKDRRLAIVTMLSGSMLI